MILGVVAGANANSHMSHLTSHQVLERQTQGFNCLSTSLSVIPLGVLRYSDIVFAAACRSVGGSAMGQKVLPTCLLNEALPYCPLKVKLPAGESSGLKPREINEM